MKIIWFFFLLSFSIPSVANVNTADCEHFLIYAEDTHRTWDSVTNRNKATIITALSNANNLRTLTGVNGVMPAFDFEAVFEGRKRLLSLGEGESDFIYRTLQHQKSQNISLNAYAVDMIYKDTEHFVDSGLTMAEDVPAYLSEFPQHYHGSYFQQLDIRDEAGEPLLFDEIISSNSLAYLIGPSRGFIRSRTSVLPRDLALMRKVVLSLKKGGILRMWPKEHPYLRDRTAGDIHMRTLLDQLLQEGTISNHNYAPQDIPGYFGAVIIQR